MGKKPVIVSLKVARPCVVSAFENQVDAIVANFGVQDHAIFEIVTGDTEPSGLLPMQMPANMKTVEEQKEDVPYDLICHIDTEGNAYDFAFGLNWAGVIHDERTEKYSR